MSLDGDLYPMTQVSYGAKVEPRIEMAVRRDEAEMARYGKKQQLRVRAVFAP